MDIKKAPLETQVRWLKQRGWQPSSEQKSIWIDPCTRIGYYFAVALARAIDDCHIDSDFELKIEQASRKDDSPPRTDGGRV